jgi:serine/threonine protein kinase
MPEFDTTALLGDRYVIEGVLGRGAFAVVYSARHAGLGTSHAVKVLHAGASPEAHARLVAEGHMQAQLQHANLVRVTEVVELDGGVALVMERVQGRTLRARLARGPLPGPDLRRVADGLLDGVAALHAAGFIHRDVKPENVLLGDDGAVRLTDLGLGRVATARADGGGLTLPGSALGTPGYMAPEAFLDAASVDERADVWSVGAVLYELCAGAPLIPSDLPTAEQWRRTARGDHVPLPPAVPRAVADAIEDAIDPDRAARAPSIAALADRWRRAWGATPPRPPAAG